MDIQKLRYFIGIVDNNFSLSNTANQLTISQPSLSLTVNQLEKYYQTELFIKEKNRFISLTPSGRKLYDEAKKIIEQENRLYLDMINSEPSTGILNIAIPPVTQPIVCSRVIPAFRKKYPNIEINIIEEGAQLASEALNNGDIDFGFLTVFKSEPNLDGFVVYEGDVCAIMINNHPLTSKQYITPHDLAQYDIIGLNDHFTLYYMIDVYMNNSNTKLDYFYLTSRWDNGIQMILKTDYNFITILPNDIVSVFENPRLAYRKFDRPFLWKVMLNYRRDKLMKPEMLLFKDFVANFFNVKL